MRDRIWIVAGLALFIIVATSPFWRVRAEGKSLEKVPDIVLPVNQKQCVAPVSYMRASHMDLLMRWRKQVVRHNERRYVAYNGKVYDKNLTETCLGCHNKREFCDRCHAYSGVPGPYCWNCHSALRSGTTEASTPATKPETGVLRQSQSSQVSYYYRPTNGASSPSPRSMP